jgi:hypothetical protein
MKKHLLLVMASAGIYLAGRAQNVAINEDGSLPHSSAILDIKSTSKGILIPRWTTAQRTDPAVVQVNGLLVYDIDTKSFWYSDGAAWKEIGAGGTGWGLNGNAGVAGNFIGTTAGSNIPLQLKVNGIQAGLVDFDPVKQNTFLGLNAGSSNAGANNTGHGFSALLSNVTGSQNTAIGSLALQNSNNNSSNTAVGFNTLQKVGVGDAGLSEFNTALGVNADLFTEGLSNATAIGANAIVDESNKIRLGNNAVTKVESQGSFYSYGNYFQWNAGMNNWDQLAGGAGWGLNGNTATAANFIGTTVGTNVPLRFRINGQNAGYVDYDPIKGSTQWGYHSNTNNAGVYNTSNGFETLGSNTSGSNNAAFGSFALTLSTSGQFNTALGGFAMEFNTTGGSNVGVGYAALNQNITGSNNTALGTGADLTNDGLSNATAIGYNAKVDESDKIRLGDDNIKKVESRGSLYTYGDYYKWNAVAANWDVVGGGWGLQGTTANAGDYIGTNNNQPLRIKVNQRNSGLIDNNNQNTFFGYASGEVNAGNNNTAFGANTLEQNTAGTDKTDVGGVALANNTTGSFNVAVGRGSLTSNTTGFQNTSIGFGTLGANTTGQQNTALGYSSLLVNTGNFNTATGSSSLFRNTTGAENVAIGYGALGSNIDGSDNTAIGFGSGVTSGSLTNTTAIGANASVNTSNTIVLGDAAVTSIQAAVATITMTSDRRFKFNINEDVKGLDFISKLRPVTYQFDLEKLDAFKRGGNAEFAAFDENRKKNLQEASKVIRTGFIAQEVEEAMKQTGFDFDGLHRPENDKDNYSLNYSGFVVPLVKAVQEQQDNYSLNYSGFVVPLVKAVQEQQQIIEGQNKKLDAQEQKLQQLEAQIAELKKLFSTSNSK